VDGAGFYDMPNEELARLILCLLVEEMLRERLLAVREDLTLGAKENPACAFAKGGVISSLSR
jgi:hypothetical protein